MNLADMQRDFRSWLTSSAQDAATRFGAEASAGLMVYQNNYRTQLIGCLEVSFPQLHAMLGDEAFLEAAIRHIADRPPHAWTLDAYGIDFIETISVLYPHHPELVELGWIEWALGEAFVAADARTMSSKVLQSVDWEHARLRLSPSLRMREATTNADELWSALQEGSAMPESRMLDAASGLIVWRREFTSRLKRIDGVEYAALLSLRDDGRFDVLCDALVEHLGEDAGVAKAGELLADWLATGLVVDIAGN